MAYRLVMESPKGPRGMARIYRNARASALRSVGDLWFKDMLPGHFLEVASSRYRYRARTEKHNKRKLRMYGHSMPNVFTGAMRRRMLGKQPRPVVKDGVMTMAWRGGSRYWYVVDTMGVVEKGRNKGRVVLVKRPNKGAELTAVNKADSVVLGRHYKKTFVEFLRAARSN